MGRMLRTAALTLLGLSLAIPGVARAEFLGPPSPEDAARLSSLEAVSPAHQPAVRKLLEADPLYVLITTSPFRTTTHVYDYILTHLPLAATLSRSLALGKYIIEPIGPDTFRGTDQQGLNGTFNEIVSANGRRVYLIKGRYDGSWIRGVTGRALIILRYEPVVLDDGSPAVANTIHALVRLDNPVLHALARFLGSVFQGLMEAKLRLAIAVAKDLSERITTDPKSIYHAMASSPSITPAERAEFARWFLKP